MVHRGSHRAGHGGARHRRRAADRDDPPGHDDCGQEGDAADLIIGDPHLLALPVDCAGHLVGDPRIDQHDTYRFVAAEQPLRLLTVQVGPRLPISGGAIWLELYTPSGSRVPEGSIPGGTSSGSFAVTVNNPGEWGLRIGNTNLFDNVDYRLRIHSGGGGDDCVSGRGPIPEDMVPLDAPNNDFSLHILEHGEVDCVGFPPHTDHDDLDRYSFDVERDDIVALNILDNADADPADHCRQGAVRVEMTRETQFVPRLGCYVEFFQAQEAGRVTLDIHRGVRRLWAQQCGKWSSSAGLHVLGTVSPTVGPLVAQRPFGRSTVSSTRRAPAVPATRRSVAGAGRRWCRRARAGRTASRRTARGDTDR